MSVVHIDNRHCKVQTIAGDGNCLFGAVAHQLFRYDVGSVMHKSLTGVLREMVVEFLTANIGDFIFVSLICTRVDDEFPHFRSSSDALTCAKFLQHLRADGTWGDSESLLALATLFEVDIEIFRENGFRTTVTNEAIPSTSKIRLVYRGPVNGWNHYDSFLCFFNISTTDVNNKHVSVSQSETLIRNLP